MVAPFSSDFDRLTTEYFDGLLREAGYGGERNALLTVDLLLDWCNSGWRLLWAEIATQSPASQPILARCGIATFVRNLSVDSGTAFMKVARWMAEVELPRLAGLPQADLNPILGVLTLAGYEGLDIRRIGVRTIREWDHEADVPDVADIRKGEWHTVDEYVALARAGHLPGAPLTRKRMAEYIHRLQSEHPERHRMSRERSR